MSDKIVIRNLSDVLEKVIDYRGKTPKKLGGDWSESGYRALSALNVKSSGLDNVDQIRYLDESLYKKWMKDEVKNKDILLTSEAPSGQVMYWNSDEKIVLSQRLFALRVNENHDPEFIAYYLKSNIGQKAIFDKMSGSTVSGISAKMFDYIPVITHTSRDIESSIAQVLSTIDKQIEINKKVISILEDLLRTIYDYWFVQFDFPDANGNPYKLSGGDMVYDNNLKHEIPKGWNIAEIKSLSNIFDSKRVPLSSKQRQNKKGTFPYHGATGIMDYIDDYLFDGEYILLAEDGSVMNDEGFPNLQYVKGQFWVNNHAHVLQAKETMNNEFLYRTLQYVPVIRMLTGSVQMKINQENLMSTKILIPPQQLLEIFSKFATPARDQVFEKTVESKKLSELRDWLLPLLINGQVSVKL